MKLLIMQSSPVSCNFLPLRPTHHPRHPILEHPKPVLLLMSDAKFHVRQELQAGSTVAVCLDICICR